MANAKRQVLSAQQQQAIALQLTKELNNMTDEDIAKKIGVNRSTLYGWRKQELYNSELLKQAEAIQKSFIPEAYLQLRRLISNPRAKDSNRLRAIEVLLKNQGKMREVREDTITLKTMDQELNEALEELERM